MRYGRMIINGFAGFEGKLVTIGQDGLLQTSTQDLSAYILSSEVASISSGLDSRIGSLELDLGDYILSSEVADISSTLNGLITDNSNAIDQLETDLAALPVELDTRFVNLSGDTMTGALTVPSLTVQNDTTINGNLYVNGTEFIVDVQSVSAADNLIVINAGEVGPGVTNGLAGIEVDRGSLTNYQFLFDEFDDSFKIGEAGDLQKVATREDIPLDAGYATWNAAESRFDTVTASTLAATISGFYNFSGETELFEGTGITITSTGDSWTINVTDYISSSEVALISSGLDSAIDSLASGVAAVTADHASRISAIESDYLTSTDKTELETLVSTVSGDLETFALDISSGLHDRLVIVEQDYVSSGDLANLDVDLTTLIVNTSGDLQSQIDAIEEEQTIVAAGTGISVVEEPTHTWTVAVTGDYATNSTVSSVSGALDTRLLVIEGDYLTSADRTSLETLVGDVSGDLQGQIDVLAGDIAGDIAGLDSRFVNITGDTMTGDLTINGNLYVNGTEFIVDTTSVSASDNLIVINAGEVGPGVTAGFAGIEVDRGSETNYQFMFRESDDSFVIGEIGSLQAVATRENEPLVDGIAQWNDTLSRFDTISIEALAGDISGFYDFGSDTIVLGGTGVTVTPNGDEFTVSVDDYISSTEVALISSGLDSRLDAIETSSSRFLSTFEESNISGGELTVTHNLDEEYVSVTVFDNNKKVIKPDEITMVDANTLVVEFSTFQPITGTWRVLVIK